MERDFVGYGRNRPQIQCPGGARLAISLVVNDEEGSEYSNPGRLPAPRDQRRGAIARPPGQRNLFNESFFEYGSRVDAWHLLDLFQLYGVRSTFFCCALALEHNPAVACHITALGHEACGHGYRWEEYHLKDVDAEREAISKTVVSLTRTTGERPVGWFNRYGPSLNTQELVAPGAALSTTAPRRLMIYPTLSRPKVSRGW